MRGRGKGAGNGRGGANPRFPASSGAGGSRGFLRVVGGEDPAFGGLVEGDGAFGEAADRAADRGEAVGLEEGDAADVGDCHFDMTKSKDFAADLNDALQAISRT